MKNKETFEKTIAILVKAYHEGVLLHGDYCACAVGNIISSNLSLKIQRKHHILQPSPDRYRKAGLAGFYEWVKEDSLEPHWNNVFHTIETGQEFRIHNYQGEAKRQIDSSGYDLESLMRIEKAFDTHKYIDDKDGYKGLMSVCDVLMEIHECTAEQITKAKALF